MRVSELQGKRLDELVAQAMGVKPLSFGNKDVLYIEDESAMYGTRLFNPSRSWAIAGLLIEKCRISLCHDQPQWIAYAFNAKGRRVSHSAETPLVAAMRCYVALAFGEEVTSDEEIPRLPGGYSFHDRPTAQPL